MAMYVAGNYYRWGGQFDGATSMHVVLTLSAGEYPRLYVNGVLVLLASYSLPAIPVPTYFNIGHSGGDAYSYLLGSVDEFRIWGGVLSANEVLSNYFAGTGKQVFASAFPEFCPYFIFFMRQITSVLDRLHSVLGALLFLTVSAVF